MEQTKELNTGKKCIIQGVMWRKLCPYLPIIGIVLTLYYHLKYSDTGIEDDATSWITAFIQAVSVFALISYANA